TGHVVAPGFIDSANLIDMAYLDYADMTLASYPDNRLIAPSLHQGVTTLLWGESGQWTPSTIKDFQEVFTSGDGLGANVAVYAGHLAIRKEVMGMEQRSPTKKELERMNALVRAAMELGAVGLSTPLLVVPARYSDTDELVALAKEVALFDGIFNSHFMRNPFGAAVESVAEVIDIGRKADIPVKLEAIRVGGLRNKGLISDIIAMINEARSDGVEMVTGQYPYDAGAAYLLSDMVLIPGEHLAFRQPFDPERLRRLRTMLQNREQRSLLKDASENGVDGGVSYLKLLEGYDGIRIESVPGKPNLAGRYLVHIAEQRGIDPFDALSELIVEADDKILIAIGASDEEDDRALLVQPWNMISSFGEDIAFTPFRNHPRSTGTFPRVLGHYVREENLLSLPEAIRKMTSMPADFLRLYDRGRIRAGLVADVVIFDPAQIAARSTWLEPDRFSTGVIHLIVNGISVIEEGELTGSAPGKFVTRQTPQSGSRASSDCSAEHGVSYLCGFVIPEDIVNVGSTGLVLASGGAGPGLMYLINPESGTRTELINSGTFRLQHDSNAWPDCPGKLNLEAFDVHGLSLTETADGLFSIYSTSHGEREAIEIYELDLTGGVQGVGPVLTWTGCVMLQQDGHFNSVAQLRDGGFVTTRMIDQDANLESVWGTITGRVFEWHPGAELQPVAGTELSLPNGIAVSADQRYMYVTATGTEELVRFDRGTTPIGRRTVPTPMGPDNIHWDSKGMLMVAGAHEADPASCDASLCFAGWEVIEVDPETLEIAHLAGADDSASMRRASAAIRVGNEIWVSGPDRIARIQVH
ncbi:MAG: amidohydrolase family protein, partial [Pseudomonadales bacterium]